jgi:hypothetical protein
MYWKEGQGDRFEFMACVFESTKRSPMDGRDSSSQDFLSIINVYGYIILKSLLAYVNHQKDSEDLHYQTSCEENGLTTGREHKCVLFNEAENY